MISRRLLMGTPATTQSRVHPQGLALHPHTHTQEGSGESLEAEGWKMGVGQLSQDTLGLIL